MSENFERKFFFFYIYIFWALGRFYHPLSRVMCTEQDGAILKTPACAVMGLGQPPGPSRKPISATGQIENTMCLRLATA